MRRNLLVKVEWSFLGRKTSLCQVTKILVYPSIAFEDVKKASVSRAKEKRARDEGLFMRQSGKGQLWGDLE